MPVWFTVCSVVGSLPVGGRTWLVDGTAVGRAGKSSSIATYFAGPPNDSPPPPPPPPPVSPAKPLNGFDEAAGAAAAGAAAAAKAGLGAAAAAAGAPAPGRRATLIILWVVEEIASEWVVVVAVVAAVVLVAMVAVVAVV